jgi:hypothetical protein
MASRSVVRDLAPLADAPSTRTEPGWRRQRSLPGASTLAVLIISIMCSCNQSSLTNLGATADAGSGTPVESSPASTSVPEGWSEQEILDDARVCFRWTVGRVELLKKDRGASLKVLSDRLDADGKRARALVENVKEVEKFQTYFVRAHDRAKVEGRALKTSGRDFSERQAQCIIGRLERYLKERRPLLDAYQKAEERSRAEHEAIKADLGKIERLRERSELAYREVSLAEGFDNLAELRRVGAALALMAESSGTQGGAGSSASVHLPAANLETIAVDDLINDCL